MAIKNPFVAKKVKKGKLEEKPHAISKEHKDNTDELAKFQVGDLVYHGDYGEGMVERYSTGGKITCVFGGSLRDVSEDSLVPAKPEILSDDYV